MDEKTNYTLKPEYYETFYKDWKRNHDMLWDIDQKMLIGLHKEIEEKFIRKGKLSYSDKKLFNNLIKVCDDIHILQTWVEGFYLRTEQKIPSKIRMKKIKEEINSYMEV